MVRPQKIEVVERAGEKLGRAKAVVVVGYQGMTVEEMTGLRGKLREVGSELRVVKNRLSKRALAQAQCEALDDLLTGPVALAFGYEDPAALAKACVEYAKGHEKLVVKGGLIDKKRLDAAKLRALSKLPGRPQLLAQMAGTLKAPAQRMATAMKQAVAKLAYAMKARADQLDAQPAPGV
jgi:large subunit ribosomal protein L10